MKFHLIFLANHNVLINNKKCYKRQQLGELNVLAPFRRPSLEFSKAAFVINLKAEVRAPDAAKPARKDWTILSEEDQNLEDETIPKKKLKRTKI